MEKYNSLSEFIDVLETLVSNMEMGKYPSKSINSSTSVNTSDVIKSIDMDEWRQIQRIIDENTDKDDPHKSDTNIYNGLRNMGFNPDEIHEIVKFAEV